MERQAAASMSSFTFPVGIPPGDACLEEKQDKITSDPMERSLNPSACEVNSSLDICMRATFSDSSGTRWHLLVAPVHTPQRALCAEWVGTSGDDLVSHVRRLCVCSFSSVN